MTISVFAYRDIIDEGYFLISIGELPDYPIFEGFWIWSIVVALAWFSGFGGEPGFSSRECQDKSDPDIMFTSNDLLIPHILFFSPFWGKSSDAWRAQECILDVSHCWLWVCTCIEYNIKHFIFSILRQIDDFGQVKTLRDGFRTNIRWRFDESCGFGWCFLILGIVTLIMVYIYVI